MGQTIPTIEPAQIGQGVTTKWTRDLASFPVSEGWHLSYRLAGPRPTTINAAASNGAHLVTVTSASSAQFPVGIYPWQSTVASPAIGESYMVSQGRFEVPVNFNSIVDSGYDYRTYFEVGLDAIKATLLGNATKAQMSFSIDGRSLQYRSSEQLRADLDYFQSKVDNENAKKSIANGGGNPNKIRVRFSRA